MKLTPYLLLPLILCYLPAWGLEPAKVTEAGLNANFYSLDVSSKKPCVIVVGGSGGGIAWQDQQARTLAENGFAALALAYFDGEGLPTDLEEIPLEYFASALSWLDRQEGVDAARIGICGISKGAELALLLAAHYPQLKAVAALAPAAYVFQSVATGWPVTSSWSKDGKPLPFVPYLVTQNFDRHNLSIMYSESIGQEQYLEAAAIPVERIGGPVLLVSGGADKIWPSREMADRITTRLEVHQFTHHINHITYPEAGHSIARIGADPEGRNGGTAQANLEAQRGTQRHLLRFFKDHL